MPRRSWKNILSPEEKPTADKLFERFLRIKESEGQTMIGTEVAAIFLKRRVQPIMSRAHPMWLYSGPKDETRVNVAELSDKELLDEVRRLTHFSQEDSIPLISLQPPFDADHPPAEVIFSFMFVLTCCFQPYSFYYPHLILSIDPDSSQMFSRLVE
jgi:hypothetical protein